MTRPVRRGLLLLGLGAVLALGLVWFSLRGDAEAVDPNDRFAPPVSQAPEPVRARPTVSSGIASGPGGAVAPASASDGPDTRRERLERAERTLAEYRKATQYPPESRPAREQPGQMEPAAPERKIPFERAPGDTDEDAPLLLVLGQDRVFLSGDEAVTLAVRCEDRRGNPQRCELGPGTAHEAPHIEGATPLAPVPVVFHDDGRDGDAAASDLTFTARFAPARDGFLGSSGTLRVDVTARAGSSQRTAFFDLLYTASPPAQFTGEVNDSVVAGSLALDVGLAVKTPGRYVLTGRIDDADGKPFALAEFNDELGAGTRKARLIVFGKLLVDEQPKFPLRLRDLEGFLLREQGDPDRDLLPMRSGLVHTTRVYRIESFSPAEWQSEQRDRYLQELTRDVDSARKDLEVPRSQ